MGLKARVLLYAASPLFNGGLSQYRNFTNKNGEKLFLKKIKRSGGLLLNIQKRLSSIWKIMAINLFPEMRINLLLY